MDKQILEIAERIKGIRELSELSADTMAQQLGISTADYLEYEEGKKDFSFTFLFKCAGVFNVDLRELITGETAHLSTYTLERNGQGMAVKRRKGFEYLHLASRMRSRLAEPFMVTAPYSEEKQSLPIALSTHNGQELDYVIEGNLKVEIDGHIEVLGPGDSIYYNSGLPHGMIAVGGDKCRFLAVVLKP